MNDDKLLNPARTALTSFLKEKKMRRTPERYAILEKVFSTDAHFYADALHEALELDGYHVSLSTVYSTIQLLLEAGLVRRHQFGNQPAQYERVLQGITESHHHLVCTSCGRIRDIKAPELMNRINALKYPTFKTEFFTLTSTGYAPDARNESRKTGLRNRTAPRTDLPDQGTLTNEKIIIPT